MIEAVITEPRGYRCAPEGHTTVSFPFGTKVSGIVAEWALAAGAAEKRGGVALDTKVVSAPEVKKKSRRKPRR